RGPGLPARAAARRRALAAPPERGAGFLGMRRLRRWLARLLVAMVLMALALAVGSRTGAVRALERSAVVHFLERATDARVRLGQVGGTLGHSLVLEDLRLAAGGRTVVHVPRLEIVYAPLALLRGVLRLERVTLTAPRVRAVREGGARPFALQPGGGAGRRGRDRRTPRAGAARRDGRARARPAKRARDRSPRAGADAGAVARARRRGPCRPRSRRPPARARGARRHRPSRGLCGAA